MQSNPKRNISGNQRKGVDYTIYVEGRKDKTFWYFVFREYTVFVYNVL